MLHINASYRTFVELIFLRRGTLRVQMFAGLKNITKFATRIGDIVKK
jgi:hypothetical protein